MSEPKQNKKLTNLGTTPNASIYFAKSQPSVAARTPPKYTLGDWEFNNNFKFRIMKDQEKLVEKQFEESKRTIDEVREMTKNGQRQVEHLTKERVAETRFLSDELKKQKKTAMLEIESLSTYISRIKTAIKFLNEKALAICQQCMVWREARIGLELCIDEVDKQLRGEAKIIKGCQQLLNRIENEATEQLRSLRAAMVLLDLDLEQKHKAELIDEENNRLKQGHYALGRGVDLSLWHCRYSLAEWYHQTSRNIENNSKELTSALNLRSYIDILLNQVCEDMRNQTDRTNQAFEYRIKSVKLIKRALEDKHNQTTASIMNVEQTTKILQVEINDKDRAMLLCTTRLSNRTRRHGLELTCDLVHEALYLELNTLQVAMCKLKQKLDENKALLRYLQHVQIMQEEEINLKANDIKIDECDCMTLREALVYTHL